MDAETVRGFVQLLVDLIEAAPTPLDLHLVSHGRPGGLLLGRNASNPDAWLDGASAPQLLPLRGRLRALYLYGCEAAQGDAGELFIEDVALLVDCPVAGSTTPTGLAKLGGDWALERFARTTSPTALHGAAFPNWVGLLSTSLPLGKVQEFFLPYPDKMFQASFNEITALGNSLSNIMAIAVTRTGMQIVWDHWEDG